MAKIRKRRNYKDLFAEDRAFPTAEDINAQVAKLTNKVAESKDVQKEVTRGRKPLEVKKIPYTTAITEGHKFQLKLQAMKEGIRPSDMLDKILSDYFKKNDSSGE